MAVLVTAAKVALLVFLAGGVSVILLTYYRRRRAGVVPWRPANSRILGYDAPAAVIAEIPAPSHTVGEPDITGARRPAADEPRTGDGGADSSVARNPH